MDVVTTQAAPRRKLPPRVIPWGKMKVGNPYFYLPKGTDAADGKEIFGKLEAISRSDLGEIALRNAYGFTAINAFRIEGDTAIRQFVNWTAWTVTGE